MAISSDSAVKSAVLEAPAAAADLEWLHVPAVPRPWRHPLRAIGWTIRTLFGIASLVLFLAVIAAIPGLNVVALGYLLKAEGRVARSGRLRDSWPLLGLAPRLGGIALGMWLWLFPLRLMADAAADARLISPGSPIAKRWETALSFAAIAVTLHLCLALARGGSLGCFFRPIRNVRWLVARVREGGYWTMAGDRVRDFVRALRLPHHFWLGLRGFVGPLLWLAIPSALLAVLHDTSKPGQVLITLFGGLLMVIVLGWVPLLQAQFAADGRWRSLFELRRARELFRRAPLLWAVALIVLYALSLPLYLFKVALPPQDAMWGVTLVFIATIYPARVLIGWVYSRAIRRERDAGSVWSWSARLLLFAALAAYTFLLFFTPTISEHGKSVLFEHHALLLPVPF